VVVTTTSVAGEAGETHLWVVDLQGSSWLRSGCLGQDGINESPRIPK
jgi:hypothetical protein